MILWFRYLFRHLTATFSFFLACSFAIYIVLDLSVHGVRFLSSGTTSWAEISLFYFRTFSLYLPYFAPVTFLLATLKVLIDLNAHNELVALQMAGLSKKTLLRPFFTLAALLACALYANSQWLSPGAMDDAEEFRLEHSTKKKKVKRESLYNITLADRSELVYQSCEGKELFDVFWVKTPDDIWHMKYFHVETREGRLIDHLQRNRQGQLEKGESFSSLLFPALSWDRGASAEHFIPFDHRPLFTLLFTRERGGLLAHLHYKLALPLLPFFILLGISPIAMRFNRSSPTFLITALGLFATIALLVILDGMLILGENQVLPGFVAIWTPLVLLFGATLYPFAKL